MKIESLEDFKKYMGSDEDQHLYSLRLFITDLISSLNEDEYLSFVLRMTMSALCAQEKAERIQTGKKGLSDDEWFNAELLPAKDLSDHLQP